MFGSKVPTTTNGTTITTIGSDAAGP